MEPSGSVPAGAPAYLPRVRPGTAWLPLAAVALAFLVLYRDVLVKLVRDWSVDENYSHGFLIVPMALYLAWERRAQLVGPSRPSVLGLAVVLGSLAVLAAGTLGAELFLTRISMLGVIAGSVLWLSGWRTLRAAAFPIGFLLLMIPIPAILFNQVAFPLQLLASRFGELALTSAGIPVLREGNVITLSHMSLEVVEACSGIRSLVSLLTLAIVYGYVAERRNWLRVTLALSAIPVAIVANGVRVAGTGIAAQFWGQEGADGFFHSFSGWIIFLVATAMLLAVHRLVAWVAPDRAQGAVPLKNASGAPLLDSPGPAQSDAPRRPLSSTLPRALLLSLLLLAGAALLARAATAENWRPAERLAAFPLRIGGWQGEPADRFDQQTLTVLGVDEYINRVYVSPAGGVGLYVGYYRSQRQGDAIHSPLNCLPGAGWQPVSRDRVKITVPGDAAGGAGHGEIEVNRLLVEKGLDRQVVLYWYQGRGRVVASEYRSKLYTVLDAMRYNRTDAALVRVLAPVAGDTATAEESARQSVIRFVQAAFPILAHHLPQ